MEKTSRLNLIKKLVAKRQEEQVRKKLLREKTEPVFVGFIEPTEKDVFDELERLESFTYTAKPEEAI